MPSKVGLEVLTRPDVPCHNNVQAFCLHSSGLAAQLTITITGKALSKALFHTCILRQSRDTLKLGGNYLLFRAKAKDPQCFVGIEAPSPRKWHSSYCSLVVPWVVNCSKLTLNY